MKTITQPWEMTLKEFRIFSITKDVQQYKGQLHQRAVEQAVSEGKPVPLAVLEEYKDQRWAQEAIANSHCESLQLLDYRKPGMPKLA